MFAYFLLNSMLNTLTKLQSWGDEITKRQKKLSTNDATIFNTKTLNEL